MNLIFHDYLFPFLSVLFKMQCVEHCCSSFKSKSSPKHLVRILLDVVKIIRRTYWRLRAWRKEVCVFSGDFDWTF